MKRKLLATILASILCIGLAISGCGSGSNNSISQDSGGSASNYDMAMDDSAKTESATPTSDSSETPQEMDIAEGEGDISLNGTTTGSAKNQNEKLIFTYHYSVETKEFDSFYEKINKKTEQIGGYVENSETNGSAADGSNRYAYLVLRIPADQMEQIITLLNSDSNITYQSRSSENITLKYVDMESHLKALRTEQETLLQLMEKADKLKDVISLQSQLTQVRYEIESYESQLRMYNNLVDYSTLNLDITEVERTTTIASTKASFFEEVGNRFSDNMYAVGQWLRSVAIGLISSLPILFPFAIIAAIAIIIMKKIKRNRNKVKNMAVETMESQHTDTPN